MVDFGKNILRGVERQAERTVKGLARDATEAIIPDAGRGRADYYRPAQPSAYLDDRRPVYRAEPVAERTQSARLVRPTLERGEPLGHYHAELMQYRDRLNQLSKNPGIREQLKHDRQFSAAFRGEVSWANDERRNVERALNPKQQTRPDNGIVGDVVGGVTRQLSREASRAINRELKGALKGIFR